MSEQDPGRQEPGPAPGSEPSWPAPAGAAPSADPSGPPEGRRPGPPPAYPSGPPEGHRPGPPPGYPQGHLPGYPQGHLPGYPQGHLPGYPEDHLPGRPPGYPAYPPAYPLGGYPPGYSYGPQRPTLPTFPHDRPQPYHLMLRTWTYQWWKPVVGILIAVFGFLVVTALVYVVVAAVAAAFGPGPWLDEFMSSADLASVGPAKLLGLNLGIASMIPVTWLIMRVIHRMRPRWLASVVPRMRWRFFAFCLGIAVVALLAQVLVGAVLPGNTDGDFSGGLNEFTAKAALSALVIGLTTPFQAAGEEYLFRGYLLQAVGSLSGNRWVAILTTATLFALAHGAQNFPLFFDRFAFGLIAAWLVTRTGGLEAGIALHVLNNFLAFGLALAFGDISSTLTVTGVSWWNILLTVTQSAVYAGLVLLVAHRMRLQTRTRPPTDEPDRAPAVGAVRA